MLNKGDFYKHNFSYTQEEVDLFAKITGDTNPLHLDKDFAATTIFKKPIIHGFLGGSIFSKILGTLFPGEGTVYLRQTLEFLRPMFVEELYEAVVTINETLPDGKGLLETVIKDSRGKVIIKGEALVLNKEKFPPN